MTTARCAKVRAALDAPTRGVVSEEEIADLLENGYSSEEDPTRRWCEEMGRDIAALVAAREQEFRAAVVDLCDTMDAQFGGYAVVAKHVARVRALLAADR